MQQEDEAKGGSSGKNPSSPGGNMSYDEDELIDMDDCPSDEEDEQMVWNLANERTIIALD